MNAKNLFGMDCINCLHSLARRFVVSNGSFLSVRNLPLFEHLHVAVSELEYDDLCKVKLVLS